MDDVRVVTQRYFQTHLKELNEPVEVTLQVKGTGHIATLGFFFPNIEAGFPLRVEKLPDGSYRIYKLI